jgi:hypothetical protein
MPFATVDERDEVDPHAAVDVRAQLVRCGVLPARDEPSAAFAAWHTTAIERIAPGRDRAHVRAYATWQVAHQLARTSQSGRPTVSAQKYARSLVSEAIKLTCWLHAQQLELHDPAPGPARRLDRRRPGHPAPRPPIHRLAATRRHHRRAACRLALRLPAATTAAR